VCPARLVLRFEAGVRQTAAILGDSPKIRMNSPAVLLY
jgi:hypothetical protein